MFLKRNKYLFLFLVTPIIYICLLALGNNSQQDSITKEIVKTPEILLKNIHQQPYFLEVLASSLVSWVTGLTKGFKSSKDWLSKYFGVGKTPTFLIFIFDFIIYTIVGAYFGTGIYQPDNFIGAIAAGTSWPLGLGALSSDTNRDKDENNERKNNIK